MFTAMFLVMFTTSYANEVELYKSCTFIANGEAQGATECEKLSDGTWKIYVCGSGEACIINSVQQIEKNLCRGNSVRLASTQNGSLKNCLTGK